jgi:ABC-type multidrug transport system fused ATPase/permease subunit
MRKAKSKRSTNTTIYRCLGILSKRDQKKMYAVTVIQVAMGILDLIGVAAIGVVSALAVSGVQSRQPGNRVGAVLRMLNLDGVSLQTQVGVLGVGAALILILRTLLSIFFTRKILYFLSRRGAEASSSLISRLLASSLVTIQKRTVQETLFALTTGIDAVTVRVLGTSVSLIADGSLLLILFVGLFVIDPTIAIGTVLVFGFIGFILYRAMHKRAERLGFENSRLEIQSREKIVEVMASYRESVVRGRRLFYADEIGAIRLNLADTAAEIAFMPYIGKYVMETTVVIGSLLVGASQFIRQDAVHAVATLSIFLAAGSRIAPAVMRIQQGAIQIRGSIASAEPTLNLMDSLGYEVLQMDSLKPLETEHKGFIANVELDEVSFEYPEGKTFALDSLLLSIPAGSIVAFVGSSGAGKTTLADVLLGVLAPKSGSVCISGVTPMEAVLLWPGAISYVPQDVTIANGTIRENVALGYPKIDARDDLVADALEIAQLSEFIATLPEGFDTPVGEGGSKFSGGQRQRLGIARAMFTKPKLLVLDEATSALDSQTELDISASILKLKGSVTVLLIAHRLSTVRNADMVVYLHEGKIIATGTFEEVRKAVPDFDRQAQLMGL